MYACTRLDTCDCWRCEAWNSLWWIEDFELKASKDLYGRCSGQDDCNCPDCDDWNLPSVEAYCDCPHCDDWRNFEDIDDELDEFEQVCGELIGFPDNDYYEKLDELPTRVSLYRR